MVAEVAKGCSWSRDAAAVLVFERQSPRKSAIRAHLASIAGVIC